MMVKMQHSVQRGCQSQLVRWLLGFSACPVASRLLGLSGGFSASRLARRLRWLLGFSACPAAPRLRGFSASGRISGPLLPVLW